MQHTFVRNRLYFVTKEARPNSKGCAPRCFETTERTFAIRASIAGLLVVLMLLISIWVFPDTKGGGFLEACLHPNEEHTQKYGKVWVINFVIIGTNVVGVVLCALLYVWLKREASGSSLLTSPVRNLKLSSTPAIYIYI